MRYSDVGQEIHLKLFLSKMSAPQTTTVALILQQLIILFLGIFKIGFLPNYSFRLELNQVGVVNPL